MDTSPNTLAQINHQHQKPGQEELAGERSPPSFASIASIEIKINKIELEEE